MEINRPTNVETMKLTSALAARMSASTLTHLGQTYPHLLAHSMSGPADLALPDELHPIFHGSYDWHSCVHSWWQVLRLARLQPNLPFAAAARAAARAAFTPDKVAGELAYFHRPAGQSFERPYGWAWLLALHDELEVGGLAPCTAAIAPLANLITDRLEDYLAKLTYPVRHGTHANTAFAMILAGEWSRGRRTSLSETIRTRAADWFVNDIAWPFHEPSGEDFLSPTLCVANLMLRILAPSDVTAWMTRYWQKAASLEHLATPVKVPDRSDPRIVHLDGLNLSRAWCWAALARSGFGPADAFAIAALHLEAGLPHLTGDYMGEHWLSSFALLALTDETAPLRSAID